MIEISVNGLPRITHRKCLYRDCAAAAKYRVGSNAIGKHTFVCEEHLDWSVESLARMLKEKFGYGVEKGDSTVKLIKGDDDSDTELAMRLGGIVSKVVGAGGAEVVGDEEAALLTAGSVLGNMIEAIEQAPVNGDMVKRAKEMLARAKEIRIQAATAGAGEFSNLLRELADIDDELNEMLQMGMAAATLRADDPRWKVDGNREEN